MQTQPITFQVLQIENGWLFQLPERPSDKGSKDRIPPTMEFCEDYEAVCLSIRRIWPVELS